MKWWLMPEYDKSSPMFFPARGEPNMRLPGYQRTEKGIVVQYPPQRVYLRKSCRPLG